MFVDVLHFFDGTNFIGGATSRRRRTNTIQLINLFIHESKRAARRRMPYMHGVFRYSNMCVGIDRTRVRVVGRGGRWVGWNGMG